MSRRRSARCFTVIEVLVACALLLLLMGAVMSLMWSARDQRARVTAISTSAREVLAMMDQIESDLMTAVAADPREGSGVVGDETSIRILSRGVWLRGSFGERSPRDIQGSSFNFDGQGARVEAERWLVSGERMRATVCERVGELRFRYADGFAWHDTFDAADRGRMPTAIEISVTTSRGEFWRRIVRIPDGGGEGA
ncbi:MAG: hypothetical protein KF838_08215 [Phycisphaeraceae bacterium]|nr:MAG: hypothetical protein KF838_08215 [Phycisphaeraceae bacterium]